VGLVGGRLRLSEEESGSTSVNAGLCRTECARPGEPLQASPTGFARSSCHDVLDESWKIGVQLYVQMAVSRRLLQRNLAFDGAKLLLCAAQGQTNAQENC